MLNKFRKNSIENIETKNKEQAAQNNEASQDNKRTGSERNINYRLVARHLRCISEVHFINIYLRMRLRSDRSDEPTLIQNTKFQLIIGG